MRLTVARAELVLDIMDGPVAAFALDLDGTTVNPFPEIPNPLPVGRQLGRLPVKRVEAVLYNVVVGQHTLSVTAFGGLALALDSA
jgi:hypothetical protein